MSAEGRSASRPHGPAGRALARERAEVRRAEGRSGCEAGLTPGAFRRMYASKDGLVSLFEDRDGHLTCVRTSRLG
ncbi:hypothetical protein HLV35_01890 [Eggerthellaceae bacterium zg-997]|nr:hypothetical protein [Eggerthellaceae bacterium zg-997]